MMGSGNVVGSSTKADMRGKVNGRIQGLESPFRASPLECVVAWCGSTLTLNFLVSFSQNPIISPMTYPNPTYVSDFSGRADGFVRSC